MLKPSHHELHINFALSESNKNCCMRSLPLAAISGSKESAKVAVEKLPIASCVGFMIVSTKTGFQPSIGPRHSGFVSLLNPFQKLNHSSICQLERIAWIDGNERNERRLQQVIWLLMLDRQAYMPSWEFAQCALLLRICMGIAKRTLDDLQSFWVYRHLTSCKSYYEITTAKRTLARTGRLSR